MTEGKNENVNVMMQQEEAPSKRRDGGVGMVGVDYAEFIHDGQI
jgi:hypothetical protein